jgi:hypothetical protein
MKLPWGASALMLVALVGCCGATPFQRAPLPILRDPDPQAMRDGFAQYLPNRFTSDDTVIIQAPFRDDLAVLAVLRVDRSAQTFEWVGLNQLGVKLFHLSGNHSGTTIRFAVPPLLQYTDVLLSIAQDIHRMYFDLGPSADSAVRVGRTSVRFTQETPQGKLVYEFGGKPAVLLDKHLDGFFGPVWRVRYYEYSAPALGFYPYGIVMDNSRFHYRIIVKNRSRAVQ